MDLAILANPRRNINESEKIDKYLGIAREQKFYNIRIAEVPIIIGVFETASKCW